MMSIDLFTPLTLGPLTLPNRVVMAPMTRNRAGEGDVPPEMAVTYYTQRATAGLIITEGAQVSAQGKGYPGTPGIFTDAQVEGWRNVTDAVHAQGGHLFLQLWHVGRASVFPVQDDGRPAVAPSAIKMNGKTFTGDEYATPRALELSEISEVVQQFAYAAQRAKDAGFDGVEVHGANGYLLDQFLRDGTNTRTDEYGGSIENRARLLLEVTGAVIDVWGADRVGVRLSPQAEFNEMEDSDPAATFAYAARALGERGIVYLHVIEPVNPDHMMAKAGAARLAPRLRDEFGGVFMLNGGYDKDTANEALASGAADLVSFGVPFIANPDLPRRYAAAAPLAAPDQATMYGGGAHGYVDYPALA